MALPAGAWGDRQITRVTLLAEALVWVGSHAPVDRPLWLNSGCAGVRLPMIRPADCTPRCNRPGCSREGMYAHCKPPSTPLFGAVAISVRHQSRGASGIRHFLLNIARRPRSMQAISNDSPCWCDHLGLGMFFRTECQRRVDGGAW